MTVFWVHLFCFEIPMSFSCLQWRYGMEKVHGLSRTVLPKNICFQICKCGSGCRGSSFFKSSCQKSRFLCIFSYNNLITFSFLFNWHFFLHGHFSQRTEYFIPWVLMSEDEYKITKLYWDVDTRDLFPDLHLCLSKLIWQDMSFWISGKSRHSRVLNLQMPQT